MFLNGMINCIPKTDALHLVAYVGSGRSKLSEQCHIFKACTTSLHTVTCLAFWRLDFSIYSACYTIQLMHYSHFKTQSLQHL
jgi:hypothetical protein